MRTGEKTRIVGAAVPRKEGVDKLLGRARYVDDITRDGMIYGATVRSTIPAASSAPSPTTVALTGPNSPSSPLPTSPAKTISK
jgi:CO/xanthine dehydrogenase Mo-binding subunit